VVQAAPAFNFSVAAASPPAKADEQPEPAKKGSSPLLVVGILGGVVALVALIGVGVLIYSLTRPATTPEDQVASALEQEMHGALEEMAKDLQKNPPSNINPQGSADLQPITQELQKALAENGGNLLSGSPTSTPATAPDAIAKVLKSIPASSWKVTQLRALIEQAQAERGLCMVSSGRRGRGWIRVGWARTSSSASRHERRPRRSEVQQLECSGRNVGRSRRSDRLRA
jgi:hypothetical protein